MNPTEGPILMTSTGRTDYLPVGLPNTWLLMRKMLTIASLGADLLGMEYSTPLKFHTIQRRKA